MSCATDFAQFQKITGQQIQMLDEIAKDVEREKKKVISDVKAGVFYRNKFHYILSELWIFNVVMASHYRLSSLL